MDGADGSSGGGDKFLIATFSDNIDEEALQLLATSIRTTLNAEMGYA